MASSIGGEQMTGKMAKLEVIIGAQALGDQVKSTLGPRGKDKMLQVIGARDLEVSVTNDGATILKKMWVENPAAKLLVEVSKAQDDEVGDGTTSVTVLAAELLREAETLLTSNLHPQTINLAYRAAHDEAQKALLAASKDNSADTEAFRMDLINIAKTTLSSKVLSANLAEFAELAVSAVLRLGGSTNLESIHIIKKLGGSISDSFLAEGFLLEKKVGMGQPKQVKDAKILLANTGMDNDKIKIYGARVKVDSLTQLAEMEKAEKDRMRAKCKKIVDLGINCFINRQLIYNLPEEIFADNGVMAIEHADFEGVERLSLVLGAEVTSTFDDPERIAFGQCDLIDTMMIGEDTLIRFSGCKGSKGGDACTIVLRGSSEHMLDEAERSLHDALCVLSQTVKETRVVYGAGCAEMVMAKAVDELAAKTPGKKALAMEAYARALRSLPMTIAGNAGLDSQDLVAQLKSAHAEGKSNYGIDIEEETIGDISTLNILESYKCKQSVVTYATEASEMLLRCDTVLKCTPRQRQG